MRNKFNPTDQYYIDVVDKILKIAPVIGVSAALTFTLARLLGYFEFVNMPAMIGFGIVCLLYVPIAGRLRRKGVVFDDAVDEKAVWHAEIWLTSLIIMQWNLISYIFPTRDFWGFAPMFVLLSAFLFNTKIIVISISGMTASIAISWFILGDQLLPTHDALFEENLILRIVALVISFSVIYSLTYFAERFKELVRENAHELQEHNRELEKMSRDIIDFAADIIEQRDYTSGSHVKRLKEYTRILAECVAENYPEYNLDEEKIEYISTASSMHDVGKIAIPDSILLKPGKLTPEEFEVIKGHTTTGGLITEKLPDSLDNEYKRYCREICRYHHEKYDGHGYPCGLKGDEIPISAQIVSVVDCFDALTTDRPYKNAIPGEVAIDMIWNGECGEFSNKMLVCLGYCKDAFIELSNRVVD